jgi:lysophospholipid acyltransferase (LPLAT)-like uncharacterized protein
VGEGKVGFSVSMKVGTNVFDLVGEIEVRGSTCKEAGEMLRECLDIVKAGLSKAITNITTRVRSAIERRVKAFFTRRA